MKTAKVLVFLLFLVANYAFHTNVEEISMVICTLTRHKSANILQSKPRKSIELAKTLFKKCSIKVKSKTEHNMIMESDVIGIHMQGKKDMQSIFDMKASYGIIFFHTFKTIHDLYSDINQDIKLVHTETWNVYEHYKINGHSTINQLGEFNDSFHYLPIILDALAERRSNFHDYQMNVITEHYPPFTSIDLNFAKYDKKSQTYDVTYSVKGMWYDMFSIIQKYLNFTATLNKRKDGKWGPTIILPNGTIQSAGMDESVTSGYAEMIVAR